MSNYSNFSHLLILKEIESKIFISVIKKSNFLNSISGPETSFNANLLLETLPSISGLISI